MKNAIKRKYMTRVALIFVIAVLVCGLVLGNGALIRDALFPNELDFVSPEKSGEQGSSEWKDPDNIDTSYLATLEDGGGIVPTSGAGGHPWPYTDIDTGKFHMILADQDGFVYTRGSNEKQQLGWAPLRLIWANINSLDGTYNSTANYFNYWQPVIALNHIRATSVSAEVTTVLLSVTNTINLPRTLTLIRSTPGANRLTASWATDRQAERPAYLRISPTISASIRPMVNIP